jgi:hypothetical protein
MRSHSPHEHALHEQAGCKRSTPHGAALRCTPGKKLPIVIYYFTEPCLLSLTSPRTHSYTLLSSATVGSSSDVSSGIISATAATAAVAEPPPSHSVIWCSAQNATLALTRSSHAS